MASIRRRKEAEERLQFLGWILLVLVVLAVTYTFGLFLAARGVDNLLHHFPERSSHSRLTGIELTIVPLSAIAAAWLRPGADRIRALRETWAGPWLPLRMAATLVGLCAWLAWSWHLPQASFGPDQFGYARWLGTALAAAFTIFWLPLFPRVAAILAGMIAGPAIFAGLGYLFFESFLTMPVTDCYESDCVIVPAFFTFLALGIGFVLLSGHIILFSVLILAGLILLFLLPTLLSLPLLAILGLLGLLAWLTERRFSAHPLMCAVVSGALAVGLAVLGARF